MPDRAMSAAQGDTLAPWVLGEGATTSRQAASRMLRCPGARRETTRRTGGGLDPPAALIPPPTSSLAATGALPAALARRDAGTPPRPGPALARVAGSRRMGGLHRAAPRRAIRPRVAVPRPAAPRPPGHCPPAEAPRPAPGPPGHSPPAAAPLQRDRSPHPAPLPWGRHPRAGCPVPVAVLPGEPNGRALPPRGMPSPAGAHRGGGVRSGATRPCRASRARFTRPASSPIGTVHPSAPPGWARTATVTAQGKLMPNLGTPSWPPATHRRMRRRPRPGP
jgi:hypothetical protein